MPQKVPSSENFNRARELRSAQGKDARLGTEPHVLLVDGLAETEQVLRAVFEPRGLKVDRVRGNAEKLPSNRRPNVVVLHVDDGPTPSSNHPGWENVPRIVIGMASGEAPLPNAADEQYLEKPFHYGELIRAIERLLKAQS